MHLHLVIIADGLMCAPIACAILHSMPLQGRTGSLGAHDLFINARPLFERRDTFGLGSTCVIRSRWYPAIQNWNKPCVVCAQGHIIIVMRQWFFSGGVDQLLAWKLFDRRV